MPSINGRARVNQNWPEAKGTCDRCGFMYSLSDLKYQYQWAGTTLTNLQILVCDTCLDVPQIQFKSIVLPGDPPPRLNPRIEYYAIEVTSFLQSQEGPCLLTQAGQCLLWEINVTPNTDPNMPVLIP
jgi:hypothetical protein